ncbi:MAG: helix-turn-helix domain-containing protein [Acidobacteriota bacterium]|nr:helix-turn-helix domain-containing protein [Acidobacteriota bacterium]
MARRGEALSRFVRVPVEAIQDWPRADLLTYTALAATWGKAITIKEIRKLARIRNKDLLHSLKKLALRSEVERVRYPGDGGRIRYQVTPPLGRWARVPVTVLQDQGLSKTDVLVYIALASYASRWKKVAWPTGETLAGRAGVSVRTVYGSLAKLQRHHITYLYSENGRRRYVLLEKPKLKRVHVVTRRESELISGYRAAMRGEPPPAIPELYVDTILEEEIDTDVG